MKRRRTTEEIEALQREPYVRVKIDSFTRVGSIGAKHWFWRATLELRGGEKTDPIGPECFDEASARRECLRAIAKYLPGFKIAEGHTHPDIYESDEPSSRWMKTYNAKFARGEARDAQERREERT